MISIQTSTSPPPLPTQAYPWTIDFLPCSESRKFEALGLPGGGEFDPVLG